MDKLSILLKRGVTLSYVKSSSVFGAQLMDATEKFELELCECVEKFDDATIKAMRSLFVNVPQFGEMCPRLKTWFLSQFFTLTKGKSPRRANFHSWSDAEIQGAVQFVIVIHRMTSSEVHDEAIDRVIDCVLSECVVRWQLQLIQRSQ